MKSAVVKRSIIVAGHKTSVSLEDAFWKGLKAIALDRRMTLSDVIASIDAQRQHANLSSATDPSGARCPRWATGSTA
jgi:predicted DNA-binding ribbon-helix-helix protein